MSIVQFYKSQIKVGTALYPVRPNSGQLNWPQNYDVPLMAGNYWQINYVEGFQAPTVDVAIPLLDGSSWGNCPLLVATMNALFLTRTANYQHDISAIAQSGGYALQFFDGFSGFRWPNAKANSFSISGAKGGDVNFNANFMLYSADGTVPSVTTTAPDASYPYFQGTPIRFQSLSFTKNGSALDGVVSFNINFSNNMSPDMSMVGVGPQSVLPIDCNAGVMTCNASFVFQANSTSHISPGDELAVTVSQNSISSTFTLASVIPNDGVKSRTIGAGRQLRPYNLLVTGTDNATAPLAIT